MRVPDPKRRRAAFTLLEVLCAVAVLAIVLTALARASVMGLRDEGDTTRRAQASLLADRTIEGIEANLRLDQPPTPGAQEDDRDGFQVKVEVKPFDAQAAGLHAAPPPPSDRPSQQLPPGPPQGLLAPPGSGPSPLLWVTVRVGWADGVYQRDVTRTTLLFDPTAAAPLLAPLAAQQQPPGAQGQPGAGGQGLPGDQGQPVSPPDSGPGSIQQ